MCVDDATVPIGETGRMVETLTIEQAFQAMRYFLEQFNEREPPERRMTIEFILSWTEFDKGPGRGTSDPAQWDDWLKAVEKAVEA